MDACLGISMVAVNFFCGCEIIASLPQLTAVLGRSNDTLDGKALLEGGTQHNTEEVCGSSGSLASGPAPPHYPGSGLHQYLQINLFLC